MTNFIKLGHGMLNTDRIVAISRVRSAPILRLLEAAGPSRVINLTYGYPRQSVVLLDNGYLAVVSLELAELHALLQTEGTPHAHEKK